MTTANTATKPRNEVTIGLRLPTDLQRRSRELAARDGRSLSNFIRQVLTKAVAEGEAQIGRRPSADGVQHF